MKKYICSACCYVYDLELWIEEIAIEPITPFEELSEDWEFPDCKNPKENFEDFKYKK